MATPVTMPRLGESVTEGTIVRWLKAEGDRVERDEPVCEVDTDKVNTELPSPVAGRIVKFLVSEGATVDVGTEVALIAGAREESPDGETEDVEASTEELVTTGIEVQPDGEGQRAVTKVRSGGEQGGEDGHREVESAKTLRLKRSSPVVRRLAAEHGVDISEISGTGIDGRVTKKDIKSYIEKREEAPARPEPERAPVGDRVMELTSIRRAIANRMSASKREAPHAWTMVEADVMGLVALREMAKEGSRSGRA